MRTALLVGIITVLTAGTLWAEKKGAQTSDNVHTPATRPSTDRCCSCWEALKRVPDGPLPQLKPSHKKLGTLMYRYNARFSTNSARERVHVSEFGEMPDDGPYVMTLRFVMTGTWETVSISVHKPYDIRRPRQIHDITAMGAGRDRHDAITTALENVLDLMHVRERRRYIHRRTGEVGLHLKRIQRARLFVEEFETTTPDVESVSGVGAYDETPTMNTADRIARTITMKAALLRAD